MVSILIIPVKRSNLICTKNTESFYREGLDATKNSERSQTMHAGMSGCFASLKTNLINLI